eukprot:TRINITY_DN4954_c0_g1_i2.p1 TRINITY_DN4954_c0_g1~~TRINITY_DN4954_c0_g1_i2.p1  ORF type:complete len:219 (-),score=58.26 TRINITY_DN4954_c0_g1_i2:519-1175(-)
MLIIVAIVATSSLSTSGSTPLSSIASISSRQTISSRSATALMGPAVTRPTTSSPLSTSSRPQQSDYDQVLERFTHPSTQSSGRKRYVSASEYIASNGPQSSSLPATATAQTATTTTLAPGRRRNAGGKVRRWNTESWVEQTPFQDQSDPLDSPETLPNGLRRRKPQKQVDHDETVLRTSLLFSPPSESDTEDSYSSSGSYTSTDEEDEESFSESENEQ